VRTAAIANLLLNTLTGRADLVEAGQEYRAADLPFGDFPVVAAAGDRELSNSAANRLQALLALAVNSCPRCGAPAGFFADGLPVRHAKGTGGRRAAANSCSQRDSNRAMRTGSSCSHVDSCRDAGADGILELTFRSSAALPLSAKRQRERS
jgi:hypothetical protein